MSRNREYLEESIRRIRQAIDARPGDIDAVRSAVREHSRPDLDDRASRKAARRAARYRNGYGFRRRSSKGIGMPEAVVYGLAALAVFAVAMIRTQHWWLIFVAFGLAMRAAQILSHAVRLAGVEGDRELPRDRARAPTPESVAVEATPGPPQVAAVRTTFPEVDDRTRRVDSVCDKLLYEVKDGADLLREVFVRPEETLKALRDSCHELARREIQLRFTISGEDNVRLENERKSLVSRVEQEQDTVVRDRLSAALAALEAQIKQRAQLITAASRFGAEATRILYTLENLHAQVLSAKSSDTSAADVSRAGLRRSLELVTDEMAAVAEALEVVGKEDSAKGAGPRAPDVIPVDDFSSQTPAEHSPSRSRL